MANGGKDMFEDLKHLADKWFHGPKDAVPKTAAKHVDKASMTVMQRPTLKAMKYTMTT